MCRPGLCPEALDPAYAGVGKKGERIHTMPAKAGIQGKRVPAAVPCGAGPPPARGWGDKECRGDKRVRQEKKRGGWTPVSDTPIPIHTMPAQAGIQGKRVPAGALWLWTPAYAGVERKKARGQG